jgi:hypothetical protein
VRGSIEISKIGKEEDRYNKRIPITTIANNKEKRLIISNYDTIRKA